MERSQSWTFLTFGRSGATVADGLLGPRRERDSDAWSGQRGQLQEVADTVDRRQIDVLLISIGGNDLGFSTTLEEMVLTGATVFSIGKQKSEVEFEEAIADRLKSLRANMLRMKADIEVTLKPLHVLLTEYPANPFGDSAGNAREGCEIFSTGANVSPALYDLLHIDKQEAARIERVGMRLNKTLREIAAEFGWGFVSGIAYAFEGHGYCTEKRYYVQARESLGIQGDTQGTLHPNIEGCKRIGERIALAVRNLYTDSVRPVDRTIRANRGTTR
ncbi:SGNH/GDSL hydrolase family protein [Nakamurella sp.]|uniref:SGNH/GDSL hydrolase family protein n=1 Tax=Nakamurella sp. TaxID=1869182 RepID=UPI003B3B587B